MDDSLEKPATYETALVASTEGDKRPDDDEQSSEDDDGGPDWTKLSAALSSSVARPVIPKRGEKDHEPAEGGETLLQSHVLGRARSAMFDALRADRGASSKSMSYAVWYPTLARAHVTVARGIHFSSLGHSVARPLEMHQNKLVEGVKTQNPKRLELLPEEALYLLERGALSCSKPPTYDVEPASGEEQGGGIPMSVQQAYSEMIGKEDMTLEKYQVYAYLKRLGYAVTRARAPSEEYPIPPPRAEASVTTVLKASSTSGLLRLLLRPWRIIQNIAKKFVCAIGFAQRGPLLDWWKPWCSQDRRDGKDSASLFMHLRRLLSPTRRTSPPTTQRSAVDTIPRDTVNRPKSPYEIFFNLYKPATSFRRTAPPEPDFQLVVINARTTPMPTLRELDALFELLPELPPPAPRKKVPLPAQTKLGKDKDTEPGAPGGGPPKSVSFSLPQQPNPATESPASASSATPSTHFWKRLFSIFRRSAAPALGANVVVPRAPRPPPRPNPFPSLKQGKKTIVVAVVDAGSVGFFRFGQGTFEEWPMA